jgi:hypothetical protein
MANNSYPEFDSKRINQSIEAAHQSAQARMSKAPLSHETPLQDGSLKIAAQCISVTVENGQVCLNLPFGIGSVCLPIPPWVPNGSVAQACLDICTKWGIPCGVSVTVSVAGVNVVQQGFGCSC